MGPWVVRSPGAGEPPIRRYCLGCNVGQEAILTEQVHVVTIANMPAQLITRFKDVTSDGAILEVVIWKVPRPVPPTEHGYKYSAVYVVEGVRVVGFDNERGKGDHCHIDGTEVPYTFTDVEQLIEDFIAAVAARRAP